MTGESTSKTADRVRNWVAGGVMAVVVGVAAVGVPVMVNASNAAHAQEVTATQQAQAASVLVKADAARQDTLAKSAADADQIAQQEAAQKAAAEQAAAQLAAQQAAQAAQAAAQQQAASDQTDPGDSGSSGGTSSSSPVKCPPGTTANAVDANGNESNCLPNNPTTGQPCVAYDANNNCTAWLEP